MHRIAKRFRLLLPPVLRTLFVAVATSAASPGPQADDWPQWRGPHRDGVWREDGIVEELPEKLEIVWRHPLGEGYSGPSVAAGRVYVTDRVLDSGEANPENPFARDPVAGQERILCLDAERGELLWRHVYPCQYAISYPAGPRATPTVADGRVYSLGAMGDLHCLDAAQGKVLWSKSYVEAFGTRINTWGSSAAPLVDGERLIILAGGEGNSTVIALEALTGKLLWKSISSEDPGYSPPEIIEAGGRRQLIVWTPEAVQALDPRSGALLWQQPFAVRSGLSVASPVFDTRRHRLLVSSFYNGSLMMALDRDGPKARRLWKGASDSEIKTDGLHAIIATPYIDGDHVYGVCSYGQLRCLDAATGARIWETFAATGEGRWWNAFLVRHADRTFIANEQGDLIIARLSPQGYDELGRAPLIEPTRKVNRRMTVWSHPAFANRRVYARNDKEILCADLAAR